MILVGLRIVSHPSKRGSRVINLRIRRRELKPSHLRHHLSLLLFGFYPCEDLELEFISMTSSISSKTDFAWISYCVFDYEGFSDTLLWEGSPSHSSYIFSLACP
jgi:hypothetical protein